MRGSFTRIEVRATNSVEQTCVFGTIVRTLWPDKPALNLAQRIGCTERGAQYLIDGKRRVTAHCLRVIIDEILAGESRNEVGTVGRIIAPVTRKLDGRLRAQGREA